jgi:P-type E1-E2 ATPase
MKDANIKVWMLTGDKEETAVNIGFSTGLLNNNDEKLYVNASKKSDVYEQLNENKNAQTKAIANG